MAEVWAARLKGSRGFQKLVAIKTILPHLSDDVRFERMFLDEAGLASRIRHPHVVEILDLGEQGDVLYLVMEWIDGETLATLLRKAAAPVPLGIASRLMMQACAGLHAAHELVGDDGSLLQLVHRDVSPQNLLVTRQGSLKVVDFGIAKALNRIAGETAIGSIKGKVPYMAPEQALGEAVDRRVDVFALGTVFYFLLTGRHPFRTADEDATLRNVIAAAPPRPREIDPAFPIELEEVVLRAIAREPAARFETMAAFETAIAEAMSKLGLTANDQAVKEYLAATLGHRGEQARARLAAAMRDVDRQAATTTPVSTPATPRSDAATTVTAPTRDESTESAVGSDVSHPAVPRRRTTARLAVLGLAVVISVFAAGVWVTRANLQQATSRATAPPSTLESLPTAPPSAPGSTEPPAASATAAAATAEPHDDGGAENAAIESKSASGSLQVAHPPLLSGSRKPPRPPSPPPVVTQPPVQPAPSTSSNTFPM